MQRNSAITLEKIANSYRSEMTVRARRILSSEADAEDAVQEALLTLLKSPHLLSGIERLKGWLLTLVTRRAIDIVRRESTRKTRESDVGLDGVFGVAEPSELMARDEVARAMAEAVKRLPEPLREAFVMNALEMKTFKEISELTGLPMGTLMARKKRAVDRIRADLKQMGFEI